MALILGDENYPARILVALRLLGHDVKTVRDFDQSKSGDGKSDKHVLTIAASIGRIVLTRNRGDFEKLHDTRAIDCHKGIIVDTAAAVTQKVHADRIHRAIRRREAHSQHFDQVFIQIAGDGKAHYRDQPRRRR